ncbi:uncharacterized protein BDR25DRAFT_330526 [Lindgomyces ingoldianus]|uniref:Uncharacterized protein n=1 Tax=Lindgomyces ingoldianus TaxID=673940 RepID=A0ACB6REZ8_9PLEO|nr:uncharacterized protein BDR25DRAFT_330526 [Lindgomyces ingoldianus]KAF2477904.1 hypothetical protein BDR25DRAFT_330526 [Lindgomyces ingoldianus]
MSSPIASRTLEQAPPPATLNTRRSFTLPSRPSSRPRTAPASSNSADGIETLFTHSCTKIVSFIASSPRGQSSVSGRLSDIGTDTPGSIPWRSYAERTLAVGVLRIYRVTSSNVSFLNSGSLLHTIFPRSQCWCVDGASKFVLRIRQDSYYRIELAFESEEDKEKVEEFKAVLDQVLQYEKTRSPFKIGLEAELPDLPERPERSERPKTPPRRMPKKTPERAKKWLFDKTWVPEDGPRPSPSVLEGSDSSYEEDDRSSISTAVSESPAQMSDIPPRRQIRTPSVSERAKMFQGLRSVTMPSGLVRSPSSYSASASAYPQTLRISRTYPGAEEKSDKPSPPVDTGSLMSSTDSFYSFDTTVPGTPSPPYLDAEPGFEHNPWVEEREHAVEEPRGRDRHRRQISEATVRPISSGNVEGQVPHTPTIDLHPSSALATPPLSPDSDDSVEPAYLDVPTPPDTIRLKRLTGASQRRAFSPMPHPQNLFCPPSPGPRQQFTAALVRKTCELIFGPPSHLVTLMLRIAAKISQGAFGWNTYRVRHTGEKIPCSWESSDEDEWEEDDYGIPLRNLEGSTIRRRERGWSSTEVD